VLSLAALAFGLSATAFLSGDRPRSAVLGAALSLACAIVAFGFLRGAIVFFAIATTAASALVLVLPPVPRRARPVAWAGALSGGLCALLSELAP